ncbi:MAG: metal-dependent transcriptional regulator [Dehalococcoidales bacterium]|nr:MAG: metal-dependent transcriptional regulator [Dehalococcoidales bacterium]
MSLSERAEEVLETLWIAIEENKKDRVLLDTLGKRAVDELLKAGFVSMSDNIVALTATGKPEARSVVRRHRLAERLLHDVLGSEENIMHEAACKFEHLLNRGLDDNICTLLGHPKVCPHGKPIPPGRCCQEEQVEMRRLVYPLSQLAPGQQGKVAYVYAAEADKLRKLIALGILPGASLKLIQKFPSYIFEAGHTQFAVDEQVADAIYVRLVDEETPELPPVEAGKHRRRWRGRGWLPGRQ